MGNFQFPKSLTLITRLSAKPFFENEFHCRRIKTHFHINGFALSLAWKQELRANRKWPNTLSWSHWKKSRFWSILYFSLSVTYSLPVNYFLFSDRVRSLWVSQSWRWYSGVGNGCHGKTNNPSGITQFIFFWNGGFFLMPRLHVDVQSCSVYSSCSSLQRLTFFWYTDFLVKLVPGSLFSPSPRVRLGTRPQGNGVSYFLNLDFVLVFIGWNL